MSDFDDLKEYFEKAEAEAERKKDTTIIYDGGYIRLTRGGLIQIDNPQESLIKEITVEKDSLENQFDTYLVPHCMDVENLTKIHEAICRAGTSQTGVDLDTSIGLNSDGSLQPTGVFLNAAEIDSEGKEYVLLNNEKLKEHRVLGKSQMHAEAVLDAISEAFDAISNGLLEQAPDVQRRMMRNVGRDLQALYKRERGAQDQERY